MISYELLLPPLKMDFYNLSRDESTCFLNWFKDNMSNRAEYIIRFIKKSKVASVPRPISSDILKLVWKWFLNKVCTIEPIPEAEINLHREVFKAFGESMIAKERFDPFTKLVLLDIAMLVSQIYLDNYPDLYWDIIRKPKNHIFVNQPVLQGFVDMRYQKPFYAVFAPIHMVNVQACHVFSGRQTDDDLFNIYTHWEQFIPRS